MYIHLPAGERRVLLRNAADALADDVVGDLAGLPGLSVARAERVSRPVGDDGRVAFDALVEVARIR